MLYHMKRRGVEILLTLFVFLVKIAFAGILMSFNHGLNNGSGVAAWTLTRDVILSLRPAAINQTLRPAGKSDPWAV